MTNDQLNVELAGKVMRWRTAPDRFLTGARGWIPRWRFQPTSRLADAMRLLAQASPQEYIMGAAENSGFWVKVRVGGKNGEAREVTQARAITFAVARAVGIEVERMGPPGQSLVKSPSLQKQSSAAPRTADLKTRSPQ